MLFTVGTTASPDSYDGGNIDAVIVATGERRVVLQGAAMARYCGEGRLLYSKGTGLYSIAFDPESLTIAGEPIEVSPAVARDASTGAAHFACANDGTLAFVPGTSQRDLRRLVWVDASGKAEVAQLPAGPHQEVRISPDGTRAALLGSPVRAWRRLDLRVRPRHVQPIDVYRHQPRADVVAGWLVGVLLVVQCRRGLKPRC